ncbi:MAG: hypothetical protein OXH79_20790 [Boseongicola sp.]|nr:hypothetical protein [Boseongicola sp.]
MRSLHPDTVLAVVLLAFAAVLLLLWLPADTDTGLYEIKRGKYTIGDALAPAFAGTVMAIAGLLLLFGPGARDAPRLDTNHVRFLSAMIAIVLAGMVLMRWAGPAATFLFADDDYRLLRDTVPWKYLGFASGGFVIVAGTSSVVEGRFSRNAALAGIVAVLLIIALYDLPFDDLLLPPNGDV